MEICWGGWFDILVKNIYQYFSLENFEVSITSMGKLSLFSKNPNSVALILSHKNFVAVPCLCQLRERLLRNKVVHNFTNAWFGLRFISPIDKNKAIIGVSKSPSFCLCLPEWHQSCAVRCSAMLCCAL